MSNSKQRELGLLILVEHPTDGQLRAILQLRGELNSKLERPAFVGICEMTCQGTVAVTDSDHKDVSQLVENQLGSDAAQTIQTWAPSRLTPLPSTKKRENFVIVLPTTVIATIRLQPSSGGLRLIGPNTGIEEAQEQSADRGIVERGRTVMFARDKKLVAQRFSTFS